MEEQDVQRIGPDRNTMKRHNFFSLSDSMKGHVKESQNFMYIKKDPFNIFLENN